MGEAGGEQMIIGEEEILLGDDDVVGDEEASEIGLTLASASSAVPIELTLPTPTSAGAPAKNTWGQSAILVMEAIEAEARARGLCESGLDVVSVQDVCMSQDLNPVPAPPPPTPSAPPSPTQVNIDTHMTITAAITATSGIASSFLHHPDVIGEGVEGVTEVLFQGDLISCEKTQNEDHNEENTIVSTAAEIKLLPSSELHFVEATPAAILACSVTSSSSPAMQILMSNPPLERRESSEDASIIKRSLNYDENLMVGSKPAEPPMRLQEAPQEAPLIPASTTTTAIALDGEPPVLHVAPEKTTCPPSALKRRTSAPFKTPRQLPPSLNPNASTQAVKEEASSRRALRLQRALEESEDLVIGRLNLLTGAREKNKDSLDERVGGVEEEEELPEVSGRYPLRNTPVARIRQCAKKRPINPLVPTLGAIGSVGIKKRHIARNAGEEADGKAASTDDSYFE